MKTVLLILSLVLVGLAPSVVRGACANCCYCNYDGQSWYCIEGSQGWTRCSGGGASQCTLHDPCGYGGGCFLAGVSVTTENGKAPIESLCVGDKVLTRSDGADELVLGVVTETHRFIEVGYFVINGILEVTASHPFRVKGRWVRAEKLRVGDQLSGPGGEAVLIRSIEKVDRGVRVYNIEVDGAHTFFADGYLVHNKGPDPDG